MCNAYNAPILILAHKAAIAFNIRMKDSGELTFIILGGHGITPFVAQRLK
jgi:hypothetical protein